MAKGEKLLQPQCPTCLFTGPLALALSVMQRRDSAQGIPAIECLRCHAFFSIGQLATDPMAFYKPIDLVN